MGGHMTTKMPDGTVVSQGAGGCVQTKRLTAGYVFMRIIGNADVERYDATAELCERVLADHGTLTLFVDAGPMERYEREYRLRWTEFCQTHQTRLQVHAYLRSAMAKMALSVMTLSVGRILHGYTERAGFEAAIRAAIPSFKPSDLPAIPPRASAM
jgi:hypothetical protein